MAGQLVARSILWGDERWRLFSPFELVWAGGPTGRVAGFFVGLWNRGSSAANGALARHRERVRIQERIREARLAEANLKAAARPAAPRRPPPGRPRPARPQQRPASPDQGAPQAAPMAETPPAQAEAPDTYQAPQQVHQEPAVPAGHVPAGHGEGQGT